MVQDGNFSMNFSTNFNMNFNQPLKRQDSIPRHKEFVPKCEHLSNNAMLECPDYEKCGELNFFECRRCHDEEKYENEMDQNKSHILNRPEVKRVKCILCNTIQQK